MTKTIEELLSEQSETVETVETVETIEAKDIVVAEEPIHPDVISDEEIENNSSDQVIELLKKSLNIHWQQTTSLSAQAIHLERWGYKKLASVIKADAEEEHQHSMINLARLEFLNADYQPLVVAPATWTRHDMLAMIKYNLASVQEAAIAERATIVAARAIGDEMTANIMIPLLKGSEDGIVLYESYLKIIEQMGLDNFLSIQA